MSLWGDLGLAQTVEQSELQGGLMIERSFFHSVALGLFTTFYYLHNCPSFIIIFFSQCTKNAAPGGCQQKLEIQSECWVDSCWLF